MKSSIVGVVAIGRRVSFWSGPSKTVWATFDTNPGEVPIGLLVDHMVEVRDEPFPDAVQCTCLIESEPK
jgi:hypothetical protein